MGQKLCISLTDSQKKKILSFARENGVCKMCGVPVVGCDGSDAKSLDWENLDIICEILVADEEIKVYRLCVNCFRDFKRTWEIQSIGARAVLSRLKII